MALGIEYFVGASRGGLVVSSERFSDDAEAREVIFRREMDDAEALLKIFADNARAPDDYAQAFSAEMYDKLSDAMAQAYEQRQ